MFIYAGEKNGKMVAHGIYDVNINTGYMTQYGIFAF